MGKASSIFSRVFYYRGTNLYYIMLCESYSLDNEYNYGDKFLVMEFSILRADNKYRESYSVLWVFIVGDSTDNNRRVKYKEKFISCADSYEISLADK